jgi:hypothetical protein
MADKNRMKTRAPVLLAFILFAALASLGLTSCTPNSGVSAQESDVVVTRYDTEVNFGAFRTYAMPDSVFHIVEEGDTSKLSREFDDLALNLIRSNMENLGYQLVPGDDESQFDVALVVRATDTQYWQIYSYYPGYPGWGWWGGWYPYYPPYYGGGYAFTTGTFFVDMFDPDTVEEDPNTGDLRVEVLWSGTINGVLDDSKSSKQQRLVDSINQMFYQSPYLETNQ